MRILLLTVAGLSSRFSKSVGHSCLKCLYYKDSIKESLLYKMLQRQSYFDKIVIVGGFKYKDLEKIICDEFKAIADKIIMVKNEEYSTYGSGYSMYVGLEAVKDLLYDELVFVEGDLFVDDRAFYAVCNSLKSVITYNTTPIYANKAVAYYFDIHNKPHYIYDTSHGTLSISEPFISIFNSGQVWKFTDANLLKTIQKSLNNEEKQGTNLVLVNKYFQSLSAEFIEMIGFNEWINCNTIDDFNQMEEKK